MRRLSLTVLTLTLAATALACERYKPSYQVPKSSNQGSGPVPGPGPGGLPANDSNTEILLSSSKLLGQETKYSAVAKFAGVTSAKLNLAKADGGVKLIVTGLPSSKSDLLVVEIYEGDKIRFVAKKAKLELAAASAKANSVKVEECLILTAPWDGAKSEGSCNWDVEEAK
ncbi:MAG: hypothetical protein H7318_20360 [Oligoflexus sp.]|nr:hypothetical protein [Oligoflexus sp.]